jgi:peptidyl-prolyl cis-trans isomerase B (cyclophilin B)
VRFYALSILPFAGGRVSFDTLLAWYQQHQQDPRPDVRMAILALTGNLSPSIQVGDIQRTIFNLGLTDPDRLVRQYAAAVWLKFREDHRDMVGIFDSPINEATYGEYYREYPALPRVRFVTERGEFIAELYGTEAPRTVHHILSLVRSGFYDDTPVGLNDNGRTIYIGDRRGDSWGLSLETVRDEVTPRRNERGSLFMQVEHRHDARSLFGVCLGAQPGADFGRTVFGKIVEGVDVIDRLRPLDRIEKVEIISPEVAAR